MGAPLITNPSKHNPIRIRRSPVDILAGRDFLSVFMAASTTEKTVHHQPPTITTRLLPVTNNKKREAVEETTATLADDPNTINGEVIKEGVDERSFIRDSRSSIYTFPVNLDNQDSFNLYSTVSTLDTESMSSHSEPQVLSISVSTSVGTRINKQPVNISTGNIETSKEDETPFSILDENHLKTTDHQNKDILNVEEIEPVMVDNPIKVLTETLQKETHRQSLLLNGANPDYLEQIKDSNNAPSPYQQTIVFHGQSGGASNRARSVSYSSVFQNVPAPPRNRIQWEQPTPAESIEQPKFVQNVHHQVIVKDLPVSKDAVVSYSSTTQEPWNQPPTPEVYATPEENYEVDEAVSVMSNGRTHGVVPPHVGDGSIQPRTESTVTVAESTTQAPSSKTDDSNNNSNSNHKVGYVVEGRNFRKYRVEERTSDGFIVGEYGVVSHDDGSLRGVRYTADGTINPRLIYDALMKFLSL